MSFDRQVRENVARIPRGRVATYGQIAAMSGSPRAARMVGRILAGSSTNLPWQRVINSKGRITIINIDFPAEVQAGLLKEEGVEVAEKLGSYFVDLERYLWQI